MISRRTRGLLSIVSALVLSGSAALLPVSSRNGATSSSSLPPTGAGIDISFPQCSRTSHEDLPANIPFAVIGVNGGVASNSNPCFSSEYNSAFLLGGTTDQPHASVYVNTGNPALAAAWWPSSDHTQAGTAVVNPNGPCENLADAACAYIYGYSMAQADYRRVRNSLVSIPDMWWLDVETSNTWQPDVVANAASLSGMVDFFKSRYLDVGLYSTSYQWNKIAGTTEPTSDLAGLPSWLAGGSFYGAPIDCEKAPLTPNGRVAMIQYVMHLDNDYSCRRFDDVTATIAPEAPTLVGEQLTATSGNWGARNVTYAYQWNRNGTAIPGATSKTYVVTAPDDGTTVSVTITGLKSGYSSASRTSDGVTVFAASA